MFPFSSLLGGQNDDLWLPGIDSTYLIQTTSQNGFSATAGFRFSTNGRLYRRSQSVYTAITDAWIRSALWDVVDASLYEAFFNVTSGSPGDVVGPTLNTYHALTTNREWYVTTGPSGNTAGSEDDVTGVWAIREIAVPSNVISGTVRLLAQEESI